MAISGDAFGVVGCSQSEFAHLIIFIGNYKWFIIFPSSLPSPQPLTAAFDCGLKMGALR